jgi:transposase
MEIDDFSFLKRKTYYTILVDNNSHKRFEVIPSRQKSDVVEALVKFSKVETVTRDFSKAYRAAIKETLPKAKQIIDRFHILKNLTDDVIKYLKKKLKDKIKIFDKSSTSM